MQFSPDRSIFHDRRLVRAEKPPSQDAHGTLRKKKEWTKGTTAAKEIFAKFALYEKTDSSNIEAIRKLPKPDISYRNKDRYAHNFLGGTGATSEDAQRDFYLKVWPAPEHAKFRHWFRATFG